MALDSSQLARSDSPALSSGRDSPGPLRQPRRQLDDGAPPPAPVSDVDSSKQLTRSKDVRKQDKTYRRYASQIERALPYFEAAHLEWPDYISCLGRLLKSIQTHPPSVDSIPHSSAVASKLSQCLSPGLPSGVHSKALETYSFIFTLLGKTALARDLSIFLPGLSSVLTFASLSVRPLYLSLLEEHILSLDATALRPALKALILGVLPGLEEETSEDFDRALKLMDGLKMAVNGTSNPSEPYSTGFGDEFFWQCLFLAAIGSHTGRTGAFSYLFRRLPKLGPDQADELSMPAEAVVSPEPGLLIRCFAAGLEDEQPLLQRGFLDLLLSHLPLNSPVLVNRVGAADAQRLVSAATSVVLRRDMSLNRRLWSWYLGPELSEADAEDVQAVTPLSPTTPSAMSLHNPNSKSFKYFKSYGADALVKSVQSHFSASKKTAAEKARPFRICLSLMDRWEVGTTLVPEVFALSMENLMAYQDNATEAEFNEVLRSANGFFDAIESGVIWGEMAGMISVALSSGPVAKDVRTRQLDVVSFIVQHFNTKEEDMIAFHIPLCCLLVLATVVGRKDAAHHAPLACDQGVIARAMLLVDQLVSNIPERAQLNSSFGDSQPQLTNDNEFDQQRNIIEKIHAFYRDGQGDLADSPPPFNSHDTAMLTLDFSAQMFYAGLHAQIDHTQQEVRAHILSSLSAKLPSCESLQLETLVRQVSRVLGSSTAEKSIRFPALLSIGSVLTHVVPKLAGFKDAPSTLLDLTSSLVARLWDYLTPGSPKYHVEAVRALWQLDSLSPGDSILESSVSRFIADGAANRSLDSIDVEPARRFSVLWSHSLPYFGTSKRVSMFSRREGGYMSAYITGIDEDKGEMALHRPLLLFLDALEEEETENHYFLVNWLGSMGNLYTIFDVLLSRLSALQTHKDRSLRSTASKGEAAKKVQNEDTTRECLYYLQHLSNLLKLSGEHLWAVLAENVSIPGTEDELTVEAVIAQINIRLLESELVTSSVSGRPVSSSLICASLRILRQLRQNPDPKQLREAAVEEQLVTFIERVTYNPSLGAAVQVALLDTTLEYLQLKYDKPYRPKSHRKNSSLESLQPPSTGRLTNGDSKDLQRPLPPEQSPPPKRLIKCLQDGIKSPSSHYVLENWIAFLVDVLPLYAETLFQNLIPLVETFCKQINWNFQRIQNVFEKGQTPANVMSESSLISLLNGLEHLLALAHERLAVEEALTSASKPTERTQGFFGNLASGVFTSDSARSGGASANSRLTVILSLQDAVRACFLIWTWGVQGPEDSKRDTTCTASYGYVASKLRNRARRLLDRMFAVEPLECLETLIAYRKPTGLSDVNHLLHALDGSRPKRIMPSIFNSLYSRTNPSALEPTQMSSLTSEVRDVGIGFFLIEYTKSLDDDAMDEVWQDCMTFLRDVLSNPLVHSSILPSLLMFLVSLAEKIEHTNFGEQRKMRKDISDIFLRLLAATFTSRPHQVLQALSESENSEIRPGLGERKDSMADVAATRPSNVVDILATVVPRMHTVLSETDKINTAVSYISANVIGQVIHAKNFPEPLQSGVLLLLQRLMKVSSASKIWRKDVSEIFSHPKLFSCSRRIVEPSLLPILRQWSSGDKDRLPEAFGRIAAPTSAGIMFGVGASAARLEADKKTQLALRRIALLILGMENNSIVTSLPELEEKLAELLSATPASSPSSATRAEVFLVIQALVLKTSAIHLTSFWPLVTSELEKSIGSAVASSKDYDTYNVPSLLQACKLLDMLVLMGPDGFQTHEWIFITDTIDAVYKPPQWEPTALIDEMAEELGSGEAIASPNPGAMADSTMSQSGGKRGPSLRTSSSVASLGKEEFVRKVLQPFFRQLSIHSFEGTYSMKEPDVAVCRKAVLDDLFDDGTLIG